MENIFNKLTEKAVHAMVSAIQVYNNPTSVYRAETFSILAVNGWELLLKAKWLKEHDDDITSLYVPGGRNGEQFKLSRSGSRP